MKISKEQAKYRISFLRDEINKHNRRYYIDNQPSVSDFEFDLLMQELQTLELKFPQFSCEESPTKKVGSDLALKSERGTSEKSVTTDAYSAGDGISAPNMFRQIPHKYPMLSLSNTYDKEELISFNERVERALGVKTEYVCELKIDGTAISLSYHNFRLVSAVTRGDGSVGDDVTENVKKIGAVPTEIPITSPIGNFEIRGEIFMPWDSFDLINQRREANEEQLFANPRNAAAGSLKLLDSSEVASRGLKLILYNIITDVPFFQSHLASLQWAKECGFPVSEHTSVCSSITDVIEYLDKWNLKRKELNYPTDGVVIKVNNIDYQNALGITSKFPRWATAFKFKAEQALTRLISIDYQVGRTGAITPVANLEPVTLSGSMVKRASLHNSEQMKILDIHIGDMVYVEKGGEIIPKITGVEISQRDNSAKIPQFPENCPDCGTLLIKDSEEAKHFCPNIEQCPTQIKGRFLHFSGRKAMNILIGEATIDQMYRMGYLKRLPDLYKIDKEQLLKLDGWKERSAVRFAQSLQDSLKTPFYKVLYALGIRYVGETTAKILANHFGNIDNIRRASKDELLSVGDIGDIVADSILNYFSKDVNINVIEEFREIGVKMSNESIQNLVSEKLKGMSFVVSGNFSVSREELKHLIEINSGKNISSVSSITTYLISGDRMGPSKLEKAKKLGVTIITEEEFFKLIK